MGIRKLFGIYAFSPTQAMWPVIELGEDRGLAKGHPDLQETVYNAFSRARSNRSEDEDSYRPELDVGGIVNGDVPWANGDANLYVGRPRALLPVIEIAGGKGYATVVPELGEYVRNAFVADLEERRELGIKNLLETRLRAGEAERQEKLGMIVTGA